MSRPHAPLGICLAGRSEGCLGRCTGPAFAEASCPECAQRLEAHHGSPGQRKDLLQGAATEKTLRCEGLCRDDPEADIGMMGLKRGHQCAELISVIRVLVERGLEWGETVMVNWLCKSVRQCPAWSSARKYASTGGLRRRILEGTAPRRPGVHAWNWVYRSRGPADRPPPRSLVVTGRFSVGADGHLRGACPAMASARIWRHAWERICCNSLHGPMTLGCSVSLHGNKTAWELNEMVQDLEQEAHRQAGLALRRQKCTRVQIRRCDHTAQEVSPTCEALSSMHELLAGDCMRVLGALSTHTGPNRRCGIFWRRLGRRFRAGNGFGPCPAM